MALRSSSNTPTQSTRSSSAAAASGTGIPSLLPQGRHRGKPGMTLSRAFTLAGSRNRAHLHLVSSTVSKCHAALVHDNGRVYVRDLASRAKVYVNGRVIREIELVDGDLLQIGSFTFKLAYPGALHDLPPAPGGELSQKSNGQILAIEGRTTSFGRRAGCDVQIDDESVSTVHAILYELDGQRYIRDLGSRTGTFVNGTAIHNQPLNFGDRIRLGPEEFRYGPAAQLANTFDDISELEDLVGTARLGHDEQSGVAISGNAAADHRTLAEPGIPPDDAVTTERFDSAPAAPTSTSGRTAASTIPLDFGDDELTIPLAGEGAPAPAAPAEVGQSVTASDDALDDDFDAIGLVGETPAAQVPHAGQPAASVDEAIDLDVEPDVHVTEARGPADTHAMPIPRPLHQSAPALSPLVEDYLEPQDEQTANSAEQTHIDTFVPTLDSEAELANPSGAANLDDLDLDLFDLDSPAAAAADAQASVGQSGTPVAASLPSQAHEKIDDDFFDDVLNEAAPLPGSAAAVEAPSHSQATIEAPLPAAEPAEAVIDSSVDLPSEATPTELPDHAAISALSQSALDDPAADEAFSKLPSLHESHDLDDLGMSANLIGLTTVGRREAEVNQTPLQVEAEPEGETEPVSVLDIDWDEAVEPPAANDAAAPGEEVEAEAVTADDLGSGLHFIDEHVAPAAAPLAEAVRPPLPVVPAVSLAASPPIVASMIPPAVTPVEKKSIWGRLFGKGKAQRAAPPPAPMAVPLPIEAAAAPAAPLTEAVDMPEAVAEQAAAEGAVAESDEKARAETLVASADSLETLDWPQDASEEVAEAAHSPVGSAEGSAELEVGLVPELPEPRAAREPESAAHSSPDDEEVLFEFDAGADSLVAELPSENSDAEIEAIDEALEDNGQSNVPAASAIEYVDGPSVDVSAVQAVAAEEIAPPLPIEPVGTTEPPEPSGYRSAGPGSDDERYIGRSEIVLPAMGGHGGQMMLSGSSPVDALWGVSTTLPLNLHEAPPEIATSSGSSTTDVPAESFDEGISPDVAASEQEAVVDGKAIAPEEFDDILNELDVAAPDASGPDASGELKAETEAEIEPDAFDVQAGESTLEEIDPQETVTESPAPLDETTESPAMAGEAAAELVLENPSVGGVPATSFPRQDPFFGMSRDNGSFIGGMPMSFSPVQMAPAAAAVPVPQPWAAPRQPPKPRLPFGNAPVTIDSKTEMLAEVVAVENTNLPIFGAAPVSKDLEPMRSDLTPVQGSGSVFDSAGAAAFSGSAEAPAAPLPPESPETAEENSIAPDVASQAVEVEPPTEPLALEQAEPEASLELQVAAPTEPASDGFEDLLSELSAESAEATEPPAGIATAQSEWPSLEDEAPASTTAEAQPPEWALPEIADEGHSAESVEPGVGSELPTLAPASGSGPRSDFDAFDDVLAELGAANEAAAHEAPMPDAPVIEGTEWDAAAGAEPVSHAIDPLATEGESTLAEFELPAEHEAAAGEVGLPAIWDEHLSAEVHEAELVDRSEPSNDVLDALDFEFDDTTLNGGPVAAEAAPRGPSVVDAPTPVPTEDLRAAGGPATSFDELFGDLDEGLEETARPVATPPPPSRPIKPPASAAPSVIAPVAAAISATTAAPAAGTSAAIIGGAVAAAGMAAVAKAALPKTPPRPKLGASRNVGRGENSPNAGDLRSHSFGGGAVEEDGPTTGGVADPFGGRSAAGEIPRSFKPMARPTLGSRPSLNAGKPLVKGPTAGGNAPLARQLSPGSGARKAIVAKPGAAAAAPGARATVAAPPRQASGELSGSNLAPPAIPRDPFTNTGDAAAPAMPPPSRRKRRLLLIILAVVITAIAIAGIWLKLRPPATVRGSLKFRGLFADNVPEDRRVAFERLQVASLTGAPVLEAAKRALGDVKQGPGFLGNEVSAARALETVEWDKSSESLVITSPNADAEEDRPAMRQLLEAMRTQYVTLKFNEGPSSEPTAGQQADLDLQREMASVKADLDLRSAMAAKAEPQRLMAEGLEQELEKLRLSSIEAGRLTRSLQRDVARLEDDAAQPTKAAASTQPGGAGAPDTDPELVQLQSQLAELKESQSAAIQSKDGQANEAQAAFDAAQKQFDQQMAAVKSAAAGDASLTGYVEKMSQLQADLRQLNEGLAQQQKDQRELLDRHRTQFAQTTAARIQKAWDADPDLKRLADRRAVVEHKYNAAVAERQPEAAAVRSELAQLDLQIESRRTIISAEDEKDPLTQQLGQFLDEDLKQMEHNREKNEARLADLFAAVSKAKPGEDKLPADQMARAQKLDDAYQALTAARQGYNKEIEDANGKADARIRALSTQVAGQQARYEARRKQLAEAHASDPGKTAALEQVRGALAKARDAEAEVEKQYDKAASISREARARAQDAIAAQRMLPELNSQISELQRKRSALHSSAESLAKDPADIVQVGQVTDESVTSIQGVDRRWPFSFFASLGGLMLVLLALASSRTPYEAYIPPMQVQHAQLASADQEERFDSFSPTTTSGDVFSMTGSNSPRRRNVRAEAAIPL